MNWALLVVDMQKEYYRGTGATSMDAAVPYIEAALALFRARGLPVVWIQDKDVESGVVPGTKGFEIIDALKPETGEKIVHKEYGNSFNKTELYAYLVERGVGAVVVTGYSAEYCVHNTARGAKDLDLPAVLLRGAMASATVENIPFAEGINEVVSFGALKAFLSN